MKRSPMLPNHFRQALGTGGLLQLAAGTKTCAVVPFYGRQPLQRAAHGPAIFVHQAFDPGAGRGHYTVPAWGATSNED
jgi:hypothetical protein